MFANNGNVRVVDFGFASPYNKHSQNQKLDIVGTPYYVAPEVLTGVYGPKCDTWSTGILLYYMVSTKFPFLGRNKTELFKNVKKGDYKEPEDFSNNLRDLLKKMLVTNPDKRWSIA